MLVSTTPPSGIPASTAPASTVMHIRKFLSHTLPLALPAALAMLLAAAPARAADIGYVDVQRLISEAPQGKEKIKKLRAEFAERNRELRGEVELFQSREAELEKKSVSMAAEEWEEKAAKLRATGRELRRAQREYNEDSSRRLNQELGKLEKVITSAIVAVSKRKKLDIVFEKAVYASPDIDLTDKVLAELKKMHKK